MHILRAHCVGAMTYINAGLRVSERDQLSTLAWLCDLNRRVGCFRACRLFGTTRNAPTRSIRQRMNVASDGISNRLFISSPALR